MTEWTRQLQQDDDDDDNNQVFRIIIIIVQIFLLVAVGFCCFFTICGRKFSDRFFVIATTPIVDGRRLTTEEARVYEYERRRQKELSKDIEDPEIRKKRLTTYFHRYRCRMIVKQDNLVAAVAECEGSKSITKVVATSTILSEEKDEEEQVAPVRDEEEGGCENIQSNIEKGNDVECIMTDNDLFENGYLILHPSSIKQVDKQSSTSAGAQTVDENTTTDNTTDDDVNDQLNRTIRSGRTVPNCCAICLGTYEVGDIVVWSTDASDCQHAFHEDCMIEWMCKMQTGTPCPICRQNFLPELHQYYNGKYIKKYNQVPPERTFNISALSFF